MKIEVQGVLLVHEDSSWCRRVARKLGDADVDVHVATSIAGALRIVESARPEVALVDLSTLPTPDCFRLVRSLATASPAPAIGVWSPRLLAHEAFLLGQLGVRQLLAARPQPQDVMRHAHALHETRLDPVPHLRAFALHAGPVPESVQAIRDIILDQVLGAVDESHSAAAEILGVTRQAVRQSKRGKTGTLTRALDSDSDADVG
ncbi:MAG: hypothetical protein VYE22_17410 [Myxococcota bacterium]|nr:hypothetical protein [Myxococcota bacterium]